MSEKRPRIRIETLVNGRRVEAEIEPREMLLDFVRDRLGLKGAKRSCDVQVCGSCTVLLDGLPVSACCTLAYEADGSELLTIEGLAQGDELHPLQRAFVDHSALQCGFCTPGIILSAKTLLQENPTPSREQIKEYLEGNLCRCTGYYYIVDAIEAVAASGGDGTGP